MCADFLPWVEKYRPVSIDQIISNNDNIKILSSMLKNGSFLWFIYVGGILYRLLNPWYPTVGNSIYAFFSVISIP